jgi:hypothetical protein
MGSTQHLKRSTGRRRCTASRGLTGPVRSSEASANQSSLGEVDAVPQYQVVCRLQDLQDSNDSQNQRKRRRRLEWVRNVWKKYLLRLKHVEILVWNDPKIL